MEAAIRGALEKAGIPGAQARRRIYDSARGALDRSLERQGITDQVRVAEHRQRLELLIADIEAEWTPPGEAQVSSPAPLEPAAPPPPSHVPQEPSAPNWPAQNSTPQAPAPQAPAQQTWPRHDADAAGPGVIPPVALSQGPDRASQGEPAWPEPVATTPAPGTAPTVAPDSRPARPPETSRGDASLDFAPGGAPAATGRSGAAQGPAEDDASALSAARPLSAPPLSAPAPRPAKPAKPPKKIRTPKMRGERRRRGVFASMFSTAVMLSFLGMGIWWVIESGAFQSAAERDTGVPNPPPSLSRDDFAGGPQRLNPGAGFSGEWANVYTPGRDGEPRAGADASADVIEDQGGRALRIVSRSGGASGEVLVPLGADVMQALAGRKSVLALTVRSASPDPTQIYVRCAFSVLGECGRHRFNVTYATADVLFTLDYDRALAPNEGGHLVINSDISGGGKGIDLLAVRIRPAN